MTSNNDLTIAQKRMADPRWRLNNLYHIVNKQGNKTLFRLNWAQQELYDNMWYNNIVLKARQLGVSTFICLLFLDRCLFNSNVSAGIICHTLEDGQQLFRRVKLAYDFLPEELKVLISADNDTSQMLKFSNGSSLRVGMSLRSSTFQYLHISEFGKICAKYPDKATEIITGLLTHWELDNTVLSKAPLRVAKGTFTLCANKRKLCGIQERNYLNSTSVFISSLGGANLSID